MATIGYTAKLKIGSDFVEECAMITLPSFEVADVETTHLTVTNRTRTYIPGMQDGGSFSFEANYTAEQYATLFGLLGETQTFKIFSPEDEDQTLTFSGYIKKGPDVSFETASVSKMKCECKVTSAVTLGTYTPPASLAGPLTIEESEKAMKGWR